MTQTINYKLSKDLAPYLNNFDTKYVYNILLDEEGNETGAVNTYESATIPDMYKEATYYKNYKTLTLEEMSEFLKMEFRHNSDIYNLKLGNDDNGRYINYLYEESNEEGAYEIFYIKPPVYGHDTMFEAMQEMLRRLINGGYLIGKQ